MDTSALIAKIKTIQAALSVISVLNINAPVFPPDVKVTNGSTFDYVIVGGGIAGSVVTGRLVEAGYSVLLLEAGGLANVESNFPGWVTFVRNSSVDWKYSTETDKKCDSCHQASGLLVPKALGGASVTGYMFYNKGNPSNYDKWSKSTKDNSYSWQNMQKYFKKGERLQDYEILNSRYKIYHGKHGKMNVTRDTNDVCDEYIEGFKKAGQPVPLDNIGNGELGYSRGLHFIYDGIRNDAAYAYLNSIKDNPKIHVSLHSLATKILVDDKKNAIGVEFIRNGKKIIVKAEKEVIVSAGPFKSPQLLMLSGIGPEKQLTKWNLKCLSNLAVGQNLQNTESVFLVFKTNKKSEHKPLEAYQFALPSVIGYASTNESCKYPDYGTVNFILSDCRDFIALCGFTLALNNEICDELYQKAANTELLTSILMDFDIKSHGEITLRSTDPHHPPKIKIAHYSSDEDLDSVANKIQHYTKVVSTPYFKDMGLEFIDNVSQCDQHKKGSNEYWKCYALCMSAAPGYFVGSNSMGAVVDNKFCVKKIKKLRVVDASVIPNIISGFTQAVIVAVAEKAAEIIIADGKSVPRNGSKI